MTIDYLTGDALATMRGMPDASVDLSTCSPPFLALRDYNGVEGQWGSEANPAAFLDNLLTLAVETRRVLSPFGSLAWELGDSYSGGSGEGSDTRNPESDFFRGAADRVLISKSGNGWPLAKSLTGVPTLFAWSLAYGRNLLNPAHTFEPWRIRNVIVWARSNPPVGALGDKYRPATSYITVATPSARRWFDLDAVRTEHKDHRKEAARTATWLGGKSDDLGRSNGTGQSNPAGAPPLDHWTDEYDGDHTWLVNSRGSSLAHYAMWPAKLAERLILSMCPPQVCTTCREPRRRIVEQTGLYAEHRALARGNERNDTKTTQGLTRKTGRDLTPGPTRVNSEYKTLGWSDCGHGTWRNGHVLDPFAGTSTTLCVADIHGRDATGIDIDPANPLLYPRRRDEVRRALTGEQPQVAGQLGLFGA